MNNDQYLNAVIQAIRPHYDNKYVTLASKIASRFGLTFGSPITPDEFHNGTVWPQSSLTMLGLSRLRALEDSVRVMAHKGDFVEFGNWRGGTLIWMSALAEVYSRESRVIGFDTFSGFARSDRGDRLGHQNYMRVSEEEVRQNCQRFGFSPTLVKGDCCETVLLHQFEPVAIARIDVDQYEPTLAALNGVYPFLVKGAHVHLDDLLSHRGAREAFNAFCVQHDIPNQTKRIDQNAALWVKPDEKVAS